MNTIYDAFVRTCESCDIKILSDDYCSQLLAWVYIYGGAVSDVTMDPLMVSHIQIAQRRHNLRSGCIPVNIQRIQRYIHAAQNGLKTQIPPAWAYDICDRYGIKYYVLK